MASSDFDDVWQAALDDSPAPQEGDGWLDDLLEGVAAPGATGAPAPGPSRSAAKSAPAKSAPAKSAPAKSLPASAPEKSPPASAAAAVAAPENLQLASMHDHVKNKGMWAGSLAPVEIKGLMGAVLRADEAAEGGPAVLTLVPIVRAHTPALLKSLDEVIVNATDHATTHAAGPPARRVTRIDLKFEAGAGRVTVENDGPGVPVKPHEEATARAGRVVYWPEVSFGYFLAGTNITKAAHSISGGINGLGAKIANTHSVEFGVETVDAVAKKRYSQTWRDRMGAVDPPRVSAAADKPYTRVSFVPAWAALGYPCDGGALRPADWEDFDAWLRLRAHQAAAYVGPSVRVTYNGARCLTTDVAALGRLLARASEAESGALILPAQAKASEEPYLSHPIHVAVVVLPPGTRVGRGGEQHMLVVNGVLSPKGQHLRWLKQQLASAVEDRLQRLTKQKKAGAAKAGAPAPPKKAPPKKAPPSAAAVPSGVAVLAGVRLVMCAASPGADWSGQRTDELQVAKGVMEQWALPAAYLKRVADAVAERLLIRAQGAPGRVVHDKYTPARQIRRAAERPYTCLLAAEGDSAMTFLKTGLSQSRAGGARGSPTFDWNGIISLQGVVVNAAREVTEVSTQGGSAIQVRSAKLAQNKRLLALADAFGLRYDRTYQTPEELATLNYGRLVLCVDQDLDGTGKIAPLVLVWIHTFWPALFAARRVGRFVTPLIRVYPKPQGKAEPLAEFLYEEEFRHWLAEDPARGAAVGRTLLVKYYKGLAGHSATEVTRMFAPEAFAQNLYTYTVDDAREVARLFGVYFGGDPALRRQVLTTPVDYLRFEEVRALRARREIPLARVQLSVDTKAYKLEAVKRQIPGAVDGLNPVRRKILAGAELRLRSLADEVKVFQVAGAVADSMHYHHGESISATLSYLAQSFVGARLYPLLVGVGQFGDRHDRVAVAPRYVSVRMSPLYRALFPPQDRWLLPHVEEDGHRAEPLWFAPVVPLAALEHNRIVSEGWNHFSHGRDLEAALRVVRAFIAGDPELTAAAAALHEGAAGISAAAVAQAESLSPKWDLPPSSRGRTSEVRLYRGEPHSFGDYTWREEDETVHITDLPFGVLTSDYVDALLEPGRGGKPNPRHELIRRVEDHSTVDRVSLEVVLAEGAYERILEEYGDETIDPIEDALLLRASIRPRLNYYRADGGVVEFGHSYLALLLYWAPLRKELYRRRLEREKALTELRILQQTETLRYIAMAADLDLANVSDKAAAGALLARMGFPLLDSGLLGSPEYTPNEDLARLIEGGPGATYNYLLSLQQKSLVARSAEKRRAIVESERRELGRIESLLAESPTPGASLWLAEIEKFQQVVEAGIRTGWNFQ